MRGDFSVASMREREREIPRPSCQTPQTDPRSLTPRESTALCPINVSRSFLYFHNAHCLIGISRFSDPGQVRGPLCPLSFPFSFFFLSPFFSITLVRPSPHPVAPLVFVVALFCMRVASGYISPALLAPIPDGSRGKSPTTSLLPLTTCL